VLPETRRVLRPSRRRSSSRTVRVAEGSRTRTGSPGDTSVGIVTRGGIARPLGLADAAVSAGSVAATSASARLGEVTRATVAAPVRGRQALPGARSAW
jgi:hypothetical protein